MTSMAAAKGFTISTVTRRSADRSLRHVDGFDPELMERFWSEPDQLMAQGRMLKDGDRCTVVALESPASGRSLVLKRYNLKDGLHTAVHATMRSRAAWSWVNAIRILEAGLPTPRPVAMLEERWHHVFRRRSYVLTDLVPGTSLMDMAKSSTARDERLRDIAKQFSVIWQKLGQLRLGHGDMKATNFIVAPDHRLWLIDLDGMRRYRSSGWLRRERRNDLERFMRNWQDRPDVAAIFRARIGTG
jgi:RIO-like serine/threonine protein kinase